MFVVRSFRAAALFLSPSPRTLFDHHVCFSPLTPCPPVPSPSPPPRSSLSPPPSLTPALFRRCFDGTADRCRRGRNTWGQLGAGDSDDRLDGSDLPLVAVDLDGSVATSIAAGEGHVCALLDDDTVKCW